MNANPEINPQQTLPLQEEQQAAVESRIPHWEEIPVVKRQELTRILAGMLLKQIQTAGVPHEWAS